MLYACSANPVHRGSDRRFRFGTHPDLKPLCEVRFNHLPDLDLEPQVQFRFKPRFGRF